MKRTAMQHTKMRRLVRALKVPQYAAVGILESLWHLTARETPSGDIGKLTNEDIADWIGWEGDAGALIAALVDCGWVDIDAECRLMVHDWEEHADDTTKKALARRKSQVSGNVQTSPDKVPLPEPLPEPEPEPEPDSNTPLPPSQASGEFGEELAAEAGGARGVVLAMPSSPPDAGGVFREPMLGERSACASVQRVMRECGWSDRRMAPVVETALRQNRERDEGEDFVAGADRMIQAHRDLTRCAHLLRYPVKPRNFVAQGMWLSDAMWPYDQQKLNQARRL